MNQIVKIIWTALFVSVLCACGSTDKPELDGEQEYTVQPTEIELLESTQEYRRAIAKNYLLLVGKYNAFSGVLSAELAEEAVGKLRGYQLSYFQDSDLYVLTPRTFPDDPTLAIDRMFEIVETDEYEDIQNSELYFKEQSFEILSKLSRNMKADERAIVAGTELWIKPFLRAALEYTNETSTPAFGIWDIEKTGLVGTWYAVSGDIEIRVGKLTLVLWGILPKWGWATASIDLETKEITLIHNDMIFE